MNLVNPTVETYSPFPRQQAFHSSPAKYRLFGGAAGPGKTLALLYEAVMQALENPEVDTLLMRRTFPELEASLLGEFRRSVPWKDMGAKFVESKHLVKWPNGSTTRFGYCDSEKDIFRYQGAEYLFIGVDELTHFSLKMWEFLTSRNRCRIPGSFPCMAGATNPGNIGHKWVNALWGCDGNGKRPAPGMDLSQYDPNDYEFIPARLDDNPIYANDAGYRKTLSNLPTALRAAMLEGRWDLFAGQYFDIFSPATHCARPEKLGIEPWWTRWISIDWGFEHPSAVYWFAMGPDKRVVTYREFVENHLSPSLLAAKIAEKSNGEKIADVYLSPDAFAHRTAEASIAQQLGDILSSAGLPRPTHADDDRVGGWMLMYQLLESGIWTIGTNCEKLIEALPTLTRDMDNVEDCLKMEGDDPPDSARYGLKTRMSPGRVPLEARVEQRIHTSDPTSRAIWAQKFTAEEKKKSGSIRPPGHGRNQWWR